MKRDFDFHLVKAEHAQIHARLVNWSRWVRPSFGGSNVQPMFQQYRSGYEQPEPQVSEPIDTLDGMRMEKLVVRLPEKHRTVLQWWYCRPWIPVMKVRKTLGLTTPALYELVHDARAMVRNGGACAS